MGAATALTVTRGCNSGADRARSSVVLKGQARRFATISVALRQAKVGDAVVVMPGAKEAFVLMHYDTSHLPALRCEKCDSITRHVSKGVAHYHMSFTGGDGKRVSGGGIKQVWRCVLCGTDRIWGTANMSRISDDTTDDNEQDSSGGEL